MSGPIVVIGLTHARSPWVAELSRWCTGGTVAVSFSVCLTPDELRSSLTLRRVDAVLLDAKAAGLDASLVASAHAVGAAVIGIDTIVPAPQWARLCVDDVLAGDFTPRQLTEALGRHAPSDVGFDRDGPAGTTPDPRGRPHRLSDGRGRPGAGIPPIGFDARSHQLLGASRALHGRLIGVSSSGGAGASVVAMALAQGLGTGPGSVALVDGARRADLAMYHDVGDVVPGLAELIEAQSTEVVDPDDVRDLHYEPADRGYHLMLGLRHASEATRNSAAITSAALDAVARSYDLVVVDHDPDLDLDAGASQGHGVLMDRHAVALHLVATADLMVVVAEATTKGVHDVVRRLDELAEAGFPPPRVLVCANRAGRSPTGHAGIQRAIRALTRGRAGDGHGPTALVLSETRRVEAALRDGRPMPPRFVAQIARAARSALGAHPRRCEGEPAAAIPLLAAHQRAEPHATAARRSR